MQADRDPDVTRTYRRWRSALLTFFLKRTRDRGEAEDLTHETFARIAQRDGTLHPGYVFQVAANLVKDRERRSRVRIGSVETVTALYGHGRDDMDPERIVGARHAVATLLAKLGELPERTRAIFVLYRIEGVAKPMIAASFGISVSAVEKHVTRALAHLISGEAADR